MDGSIIISYFGGSNNFFYQLWLLLNNSYKYWNWSGEAGEGKEKEGDYDFIEKYSTMPSSLKANLLVGSKVQDQTLVQVGV